MSAEILRSLRESQVISLERISDLLNCSKTTAYDVCSHRELRYAELRTLVRQSGRPEVVMAFLADLLPGTGVIATQVDAPMDIDGDGDVDCDDALKASIEMTCRSAGTARAILNSAADLHISPHELGGLNDMLSELITQAVQAQRIVNYIAEQRGRRRKARAIAGLNGKVHLPGVLQ